MREQFAIPQCNSFEDHRVFPYLHRSSAALGRILTWNPARCNPLFRGGVTSEFQLLCINPDTQAINLRIYLFGFPFAIVDRHQKVETIAHRVGLDANGNAAVGDRSGDNRGGLSLHLCIRVLCCSGVNVTQKKDHCKRRVIRLDTPGGIPIGYPVGYATRYPVGYGRYS